MASSLRFSACKTSAISRALLVGGLQGEGHSQPGQRLIVLLQALESHSEVEAGGCIVRIRINCIPQTRKGLSNRPRLRNATPMSILAALWSG